MRRVRECAYREGEGQDVLARIVTGLIGVVWGLEARGRHRRFCRTPGSASGSGASRCCRCKPFFLIGSGDTTYRLAGPCPRIVVHRCNGNITTEGREERALTNYIE